MRPLRHLLRTGIPLSLPGLIVCLCGLLQVQSIRAEEPVSVAPVQWVQVDYILFEHLGSDRSVLRFERLRYDPPDPRRVYRHLIGPRPPLVPNHLQARLPERPLAQALTALIKQKGELRVWSEGHWEQPITEQAEPPVVLIQEPDSSDAGGRRLEGSINIRKSRFYHVDIDAQLLTPVSLPWTSMRDWLLADDAVAWPVSWLALPTDTSQPALARYGLAEVPFDLVRFRDSRRIKNGETHYLDHPAMGLIVTVREIENPDLAEPGTEPGGFE
jgi:hypothetical protein